MKKLLTALLVGGLMTGSIFAFNANAPRVYQETSGTVPMYQNYQGVPGGYLFTEENMLTVTGVIESIEENEDYPGLLEIKVKTEAGEEIELHANAYFAGSLEIGQTMEVTGWSVEINGEKIFRPAETKIDGEEVLLNGFRGSARGTGYASQTQYPAQPGAYAKPAPRGRGHGGRGRF
ncbi:hypothetical protein Marpi_0284 [Marinitoga piezophila KA3]|uniref:OB-fold nucleic acid binding protein n=1 Tax=Marinitoga piezophila (strain DSM 14283 / JCM 11233 / KA3) TaxID=443254 RepID=H2J407_MARPK|nr:hypothetical protein [Marinitoga piezophila]AEX84735.1 hypothetical protein Marpi_0284 [Marinitoga piezophila KA3]